MLQEKEVKKSRGQAFVNYVLERLHNDTAFGAALRRADNPATEYQAWEHMARWCDIDNLYERLPFTVVSAALARAKPSKDGYLGLGKAIASCYTEGGKPGNQADSAKAKLRRLLGCSSIDEVCRITRPYLNLIASRAVPLSYSGLLDDLTYYGEWTKQKWAIDFYGRRKEDDSLDV